MRVAEWSLFSHCEERITASQLTSGKHDTKSKVLKKKRQLVGIVAFHAE